MTYNDMSDQELIKLLEGHSLAEVLDLMNNPVPDPSVKSIDDIYKEIVEILGIVQ